MSNQLPRTNPSKMPPSSIQIVSKTALEMFCLTILAIPMLYVHMIADHYTPFHRGFFCDDQNLKHPYIADQTVPMELCFIIWAVLIIFFVFLVEFLRVKSREQKPLPIFGHNFPWLIIELYRHMGYMTVGATTCFLFTDMSKFTIGRLRPHFLSICQPDYTRVCKEENGLYEKFVTENETEICQGTATAKMLKEARLSFMSGHSSFSFYCATFLIIYLQARLNKIPETSCYIGYTAKVLKVLRPFIQFGVFILAFWISLTRISDYFHHPLDVTVGALVGIGFAIVTLVVADVFTKQTAFWKFTGKELEKKTTEDKEKLNNKQSENIKDYVINDYEFNTA